MSRGWALTVSLIVLSLIFVSAFIVNYFFIKGLFWQTLVVFSAILIDIIVFAAFVYFWWAPNNLFFTFVEESTAKIIVKGGAFDKILIQFKDYTFNENWNVVAEGVQARITGAVTYHEPKHFFGGLRFYGFWPIVDVYTYSLRWTSIHENGLPFQHEEILSSVSLKDFVYYASVKEAEDKGMVPLDVDFLITLRVVNPYNSAFKSQDWLELVLNRAKPLFREFIARHTFEELIREKQKKGGELWVEINEAGKIAEFERDYGAKIKEGGIEIKDITPKSTGNPVQTAAMKKYLAQKEAERVAAEAEGTRQKTITEADGEAERVKKIYGQIKHFDELGKLIRTLEALEKSQLAASVVVQMIPGLQGIVQAAFGKQTENLSPDEIRQLRDIIIKAQTGA